MIEAAVPQSREINGRTWIVSPMTPTKSVPILLQLSQVIAKALGPLLATGGISIAGAQERLSEILGGLSQAMAENLPPEKALALCKTLATGDLVRVIDEDAEKARKVQFDIDFGGANLVDLFLVVGFVLEVNYAKFFSEIGERLSAMTQTPKPPTT